MGDKAHQDIRIEIDHRRCPGHGGDQVDRNERRAQPPSQGKDDQEEQIQQRGALIVMPFAEGGFQMKPQCGQTDETKNGGGADGAFQPVAAVGLERLPHQWKAGEEEHAQCAAASGQGGGRRRVGFFEKFAKHLGKDAAVGNGDGKYGGNGAEPGELQQQQPPEQFMHRAHTGGHCTHGPPVPHHGHGKPGQGAQCRALPGKGEGVDDGTPEKIR